jgi:ribonuclease HI
MSNRIRLVWVPGHCGIHENEEADALAETESSSVVLGLEPCFLLAPSYVEHREW